MHSDPFDNPSLDVGVLTEFFERAPSGSIVVFMDNSYTKTDQNIWCWLSSEGHVMVESERIAEIARWHNFEPTDPWAVF